MERHGTGEDGGMSASETIVVVAHWRTEANAVDEVLALVGPLREQTLAEPGCLGYEVFRDVAAPGDLLLLERYADDAAIDAHRKTPHYQELVVRRILPLLSQRQVELLRPRGAD
jgi:quinol monooxygenase YgiN